MATNRALEALLGFNINGFTGIKEGHQQVTIFVDARLPSSLPQRLLNRPAEAPVDDVNRQPRAEAPGSAAATARPQLSAQAPPCSSLESEKRPSRQATTWPEDEMCQGIADHDGSPRVSGQRAPPAAHHSTGMASLNPTCAAVVTGRLPLLVASSATTSVSHYSTRPPHPHPATRPPASQPAPHTTTTVAVAPPPASPSVPESAGAEDWYDSIWASSQRSATHPVNDDGPAADQQSRQHQDSISTLSHCHPEDTRMEYRCIFPADLSLRILTTIMRHFFPNHVSISIDVRLGEILMCGSYS
ncbi:unnamed protein product [Vitrella brassicaformis CCMP3155]|uniref:Uncharacterized protein n=1 Tax=Vitrella brassicaformis (strain CCMP3155) TaxID=1169540 RepID=A0A0G4EM78_VITBC|nr:unnamed protein product [Vitrella brassicaformis CCMP3155]|eukprot:CEL97968.1 unnamed protein product [Vitrella brassicaformis CCMP3155]